MRIESKCWKVRNRRVVFSGLGRGLAFSELLVILAITACLGMVLLPAIFRAGEDARRFECADNLRKIGRGAIAYSRYSDYPSKPGLGKLLRTNPLLSPRVMGCPSSNYAKPSEVKLNWGSEGEKVYSAYFFRGEAGGSSREIERAMPALAMDFNINDFRLYNHKGEHVNVLFKDGSVGGFSDSGLVLDRKITFEADRVFTAADRAREESESE